MADNTHLPDFLDISEDAQKAAAAAMSRKSVWDPPDTAYVSTTDKGDVYERWNEEVVIENAWRETTKNGLLCAVVQIKSRTGMPNEGERTWGRHLLHTGVLGGIGSEEDTKKYTGMNDRTINAISTLLQATGFAPTEGGLSGKLLNYMFPVKNSPGAKSPVIGKVVVANIVNSPNKGEKAKSPRQTNVDSYLPLD